MKPVDATVREEFYQALVEKNSQYEGIFFVGVKTTGVFCRPTCPARKPKLQNCEFFYTAKEALLASFRPCLRCKPLSHPNEVSATIQRLVAAVEADPAKKWRDYDFRALAVDPSTARRQFKKRFNMTFVEYARARRIGIAMKQIRSGNALIDTQLDAGYESSSGFRDAFTKIMGAAPKQTDKQHLVLQAEWLDTPLGPMVAIADDNALWLLEFVERRGLETEIKNMRRRFNTAIIPGSNQVTKAILTELEQYFAGTLKKFKTPIQLLGTPFQQQVWQTLQQIPYGTTRSYLDQATAINKPKAYRAVANANGANQLAIIIPCHRIINADGRLGGYGGGIKRKQWLIEHEQKHR